MNVVISKMLEDGYNEFVVVDSLKKARELVGVTKLIIHTFIESDFDAGIFISQFKESGVKTFIYINEEPSAVIRMAITGVGGYYYSDEFYLEDEEELSALLADIEENEKAEESDEFTSIAAPALSTITGFMKGFINGDKLVQTPMFLESVESAINELAAVTHQQELQITAMGSSAIAVFEKASAIIKNMDNQRKLIEKQLEELEQSQNNTSGRMPFGNNVMFFSPYKYLGNAKILYFREYSPCRYFTSFILGYANYLHYVKNRREKLIFLHQKGQGVAAKYNIFTSITEESKNIMSLYDSDRIATNSPKKEVLKELLTKPSEIFIVVDRLYGNQDMITGRCKRVNVAGTFSDINRFKLKVSDTIFPITSVQGQLFVIPTIKNFPREEDARYAVYNQVMNSAYEKLDMKLEIH